MKTKMNKKGATMSTNFVAAIFLGIVFLIFFVGGGASTVFDISKFIKSLPTPVWVVLGVIILFKLIGGKKK